MKQIGVPFFNNGGMKMERKMEVGVPALWMSTWSPIRSDDRIGSIGVSAFTVLHLVRLSNVNNELEYRLHSVVARHRLHLSLALYLIVRTSLLSIPEITTGFMYELLRPLVIRPSGVS